MMKMKIMYAVVAALVALIISGIILIAVMLFGRSDKAPTDTQKGEETYKDPLTERYKEYIESDNDSVYLMLASRRAPIGGFVPSDIISTREITDYKLGVDAYKIERRTAMALTAMLLEAEADGIENIRITSAYRTYDYQLTLFNEYCLREMKRDPSLSREEAEEIVKKYSNPPGCSEHQTGLCVDLFVEGDTATRLEESFAYTDAGKWLASNCHRFGFVLRYPKDKYEITDIEYEPWHFRYVGRAHAEKMKALGMCLEEDLEYLEK